MQREIISNVDRKYYSDHTSECRSKRTIKPQSQFITYLLGINRDPRDSVVR